MFGSKFWDQVATGVAQRWVDRLFSPALLFWAGGLLAWAQAHDWAAAVGRLRAATDVEQILLAVGGIIIVAGSAAAVEQLQKPVLRLLEGYGWPAWLRRWRSRQLHRGRLKEMRLRHGALGQRFAQLTPEELAEYGRLDEELRTYPGDRRLLPTRLGNLLRAAEDHAWERYGLATRAVWPSLWLLLPEATRNELVAARLRLDRAIGLWVWSLLFLVWTAWVWWAPVVAVAGAWWAYGQALQAGGVYGELLRAAFNVHCFSLYDALGLRPPPLDQERKWGRQLTNYLGRGFLP